MNQDTPSYPRVLMLSAEFPPQPGGVGDYTMHLASYLTRAGVAVAVVTATSDKPTKDEYPFPVFRTITSWVRNLRKQVEHAINEWQADLVHIQYQTGAYAMKPAVNLLPSRLDIPVLVTFHDLRMPYLAPKVAPLRRYVTRLLIESARQVIVTNQEDYGRLMGIAPPANDPDVYALSRPLEPAPLNIPIGTNIDIIEYIDRAATRTELEVSEDETLLVYFGMLNHTKGIHTIYKALAQLPAQVRLLIIGGTTQTPADQEYAQQLDELVQKLGIAHRLIKPGYVTPSHVSALLQSADIAVLPFTDGAAYRRGSLLAALAHGVPTVTTLPRIAITPPLRQAALLITPEQPDALAIAIQRLMNEPELRLRLTTQAQLIARSFSWQSIAERHRDMYNDMAKKGYA